jgi:hypothetical protein
MGTYTADKYRDGGGIIYWSMLAVSIGALTTVLQASVKRWLLAFILLFIWPRLDSAEIKLVSC